MTGSQISAPSSSASSWSRSWWPSSVWLLHWLYLRSSKERAFVRTGLGGQKVVLDGGAFVLPIVHDVIPVNMNTLRLEVSPRARQGTDYQGPHARGCDRRVLCARGRPP